MANISVSSAIFSLFVFHLAAGAALNGFLSKSTSCESSCEETFPDNIEYRKSCSEGCRFFKIIGLAKGYNNKTIGLCYGACSEAFTNKSIVSCKNGCKYTGETKPKDDPQTLHVLTPLLYLKSVYNNMANEVREFVSASMTVYVQEDSGSMVVLESRPKIEIEDVRARHAEDERQRYLKNFKPPWEEDRVDWMDCISRQSSLHKFIMIPALLGSIVVLIWLCCTTAVTAPHHYLASPKIEPRNNLNYVLLCEPNTGEIKCPPPIINPDEDAPPLPPKVSLI